MKYVPFAKLIRATNCKYIAAVENSGNPSTPDTSYTSQPKRGSICLNLAWTEYGITSLFCLWVSRL